MSDSHKNGQETQAENGLSQRLSQAMDGARQLETALFRMMSTLQKRGIPIPDISDLLNSLQLNIAGARTEAESIVEQRDRLQALVHRSARITSSLQLDEVLEEVVDSVISLTGAERAYLMLRETSGGELTIRAARNWDQQTLSEHDIAFSRGVIKASLDKAEPIVTTNAQSDTRFQRFESIVTQGMRSIMCVPLLLDNQPMGVLYVDNRYKPGVFNQSLVPFLAAFGTQAAIAIEKARLHQEEIHTQRLEQELSVGQRTQLSLLPKTCPTIPGWEFAAAYEQARIVSGDFYDFFELPGDPVRLGIAIADVADKGVAAAIFMALSRTVIRTIALTGCGPAEALKRANNVILSDTTSDLFLTAFYAALDPLTGQMVFANGGHNSPLLLRAGSDQFEALYARGIILGTFPDILLDERAETIAAGDLLVFYTDGVTEAMNIRNEEFEDFRLRSLLLAHRDDSAQQILDALIEAIKEFTEGAPQSDDLTIIVVKRQKSS